MALIDVSNNNMYRVAAAAVALSKAIHARRSRAQLDGIPTVDFTDGDNSDERHIRDMRELLREGYRKYTKHGLPFQVRNLVDPSHARVFLPLKYLAEIKGARQDRLSFYDILYQSFLNEYTQAPSPTEVVIRLIRTDLTKNLGKLIPGIQEEVDVGLSSRLPKSADWTPFTPHLTFAYTISRAVARLLGGDDLRGNEEWININLHSTILTHQVSNDIRARYPRPLWWLARWRHPGARALLAYRKRAAKMIQGILERQHMQAQEGGGRDDNREPNAIQWTMAAKGPQARTRPPMEISDDCLVVGLVAIHTSAATTLTVLYDLLDRPEVMAELVEEIESARAAHCPPGQHWTKEALGRLVKLDSFMAESMRYDSPFYVSMQRVVMTEYVFQDGLRLPRNMQIAVPTREINCDEDLYENPDVFDPWRFLKMRQAGDPNKYHFAYVSDQTLNFGAGNHACPGRYFASYQIKLMLIHLLSRYEMKWPEGQCRPRNKPHDLFNRPDTTATILFRERES